MLTFILVISALLVLYLAKKIAFFNGPGQLTESQQQDPDYGTIVIPAGATREEEVQAILKGCAAL